MALKNRKEKLSRFTLILNSFVFIISAYLFLEDGKLFYAGIIFSTGVFYLIALKLTSVSKPITELGLYILNSVVALITALDFFSRGSHYIQYVWLAVTIVYFIFSFRQLLVMRRIRQTGPNPVNAGNEGS
jgi:hypothetical protein